MLAVAVSFAWLGVEDAGDWKAGVALYVLGRMYLQTYIVVLIYLMYVVDEVIAYQVSFPVPDFSL